MMYIFYFRLKIHLESRRTRVAENKPERQVVFSKPPPPPPPPELQPQHGLAGQYKNRFCLKKCTTTHRFCVCPRDMCHISWCCYRDPGNNAPPQP